MGASAGINLLLSMLRVKLVAIFAGTVGIGMIATYSALLTTIVTVVSMGIHISAVRHIALASVANNEEQLTRSVVALKRLSWVLGISGMLVVAVLSNQLSFWTLGTAGYAWDVVLLSSVILFNAVSSSYSCIIQGARRVGDLARINVYGAFFATVAAFVCLYVLGDEGVIWTLITAAVLQMLVSRIYANQVRISSIKQNWKESIDIGLKLITEGAPQMLSILASTLSTLIILSSITRELGVNSVGLYSAAFALSGAFVGFMLVSMSADYYPRLIEAGNDKNSINRIVNEQTEISLLLVVPGLLLCVFFAPWLLKLLYASEFAVAGEMLQWFMLGCMGRIISSPIAFILLALGKSKTYLVAEIFLHFCHISLVLLALRANSLNLTAHSFYIAYLFYTILIYLVCNKFIGFSWSSEVRILLALSLTKIIIIIGIVNLLSGWLSTLIGFIVILISISLTLKKLNNIIKINNQFLEKIRKLRIIKKIFKN